MTAESVALVNLRQTAVADRRYRSPNHHSPLPKPSFRRTFSQNLVLPDIPRLPGRFPHDLSFRSCDCVTLSMSKSLIPPHYLIFPMRERIFQRTFR